MIDPLGDLAEGVVEEIGALFLDLFEALLGVFRLASSGIVVLVGRLVLRFDFAEPVRVVWLRQAETNHAHALVDRLHIRRHTSELGRRLAYRLGQLAMAFIRIVLCVRP